MTITEQAGLILDALNAWVADNKGRAFIAADAVHCVEELRGKPGAPTAAVLWESEEPSGRNAEEGKVLRTFKIVVSRGRGLKLVAGESLAAGVAGGPPMYDLVEQAREIARGLRLEDEPGELQLPVYQGCGPFEVSGHVLDAVEIRIALYAQIPPQNQ
jgi:hypothetical protein